ncbi:MAG: MAPEG family protein [Pseudomonadota bacterium]
MPTELMQPVLAVLLAFAHLVVYALIANAQVGTAYLAGPRDTPNTGLSIGAARMKRAFENHLQTLPWFAIVMVVAHLSKQVDDTVITCGWIYLAARVLYIPAYVVHIPLVRSAVWAIATGMIIIIAVRLIT